MTYSTMEVDSAGGTLWITFVQESRLNALNTEMTGELGRALDHARCDEAIRSVVLTARGRAFCAGADLKSVFGKIAAGDGSDTSWIDDVRATLDEQMPVFDKLRRLPKPVICGINGLTMAGGLELAMCCDVIIAAESARIADAHSNFSVFPGAGGAAVLPGRIGMNNAKYLLFTGDSLPASEFHRMGLVQEVVADDQLSDRLKALATQLNAKSPAVLSRMKEVVNATLEMSVAGALRYETEMLRNHLHSRDLLEGLTAFIERSASKKR